MNTTDPGLRRLRLGAFLLLSLTPVFASAQTTAGALAAGPPSLDAPVQVAQAPGGKPRAAPLPDADLPAVMSQAPLWHSNFDNGLNDWNGWTDIWGNSNRSFAERPGIQGRALRVAYPRGSIDPVAVKRDGLPLGGTGFKFRLPGSGYEKAWLSYKVWFPDDFKQGLGGKLPGLCGGTCNAGGKPPNGVDGFSTRYMWTGNFMASVYAYLPSATKFGIPIGARKIPLKRGSWVQLVQELILNQPGQQDGRIRVWADGRLVVDAQNLRFRDSAALKVDSIKFETFYGGQTPEWAAPDDTTVEFAEFAVWGQ
jgi:hypothetical protein